PWPEKLKTPPRTGCQRSAALDGGKPIVMCGVAVLEDAASPGGVPRDGGVKMDADNGGRKPALKLLLTLLWALASVDGGLTAGLLLEWDPDAGARTEACEPPEWLPPPKCPPPPLCPPPCCASAACGARTRAAAATAPRRNVVRDETRGAESAIVVPSLRPYRYDAPSALRV